MACQPNPSTRSEPSPQARARRRGCRFLWFLSFGQAKESNWPPWMADKPHTDVSRLSRKPETANQLALTLPSPASGRGKAHQTATQSRSPQQTTAILPPQARGEKPPMAEHPADITELLNAAQSGD